MLPAVHGAQYCGPMADFRHRDRMPAEPLSVTWNVATGDGESVTAVFDAPIAMPTGTLFVCAHGAGGHLADRGTLAAARELGRRGAAVVRFNFVYRERESRRPDPMPKLQACYTAVVAHVRAAVTDVGGTPVRRLLIGGRSMGGRVASMMAADGFACDGLVLLAFPLHPEGQPEKLRDAHLPRIRVPVLCVNGTRDALCDRALMDRAVGPLAPRWTMHWLDAADHSFHVLKSSGRTDADVLAEAGTAFARWESGLAESGSTPSPPLTPARDA